MTKILTFKPRAGSADKQRPVPTKPAEIIVFPGVRYERRNETLAEMARKGGPKRRPPAALT